jgi:hypothetical protein
MSLKEWMSEQKVTNRWTIAKVFLAGMFAGAVLATIYFILLELVLTIGWR